MHLKIFKMDDKMDVHDLPKATLEKYFYAGFEYKTIVLLLEKHHSLKASVRIIRRVLGNFGLKRRGQSVDIDELRNRMRAEMEEPVYCMSWIQKHLMNGIAEG